MEIFSQGVCGYHKSNVWVKQSITIVCVYTYIHICMYVCMYVYIYTHTHTHTHTHFEAAQSIYKPQSIKKISQRRNELFASLPVSRAPFNSENFLSNDKINLSSPTRLIEFFTTLTPLDLSPIFQSHKNCSSFHKQTILLYTCTF